MSKEEKNIDLLVVSYVDQTLTANEQADLEQHLAQDHLFKKEFIASVETYRNYRQLKATEAVSTDTAWEVTKSKFTRPFDNQHSPKVRKLAYTRLYRIAAAVLVLLTASYFVKIYVIGTKSLDALDIPKEEITLTLSNGESQQLNMASNKNVTSKNGTVLGQQQGATVQFNGTSGTSSGMATLKIPFGKQFNVTLSDGTKVYLNAGTTLKFPQQFVANAPMREVSVEGEAYFMVTKNAKQPFVVHTDKMDVKVLGTQFNVRTYAEENTQEVVLKEGAVAMNTSSNQQVVLRPGEMGYRNEGQAVKTKEVFVSNYTSWINGELIYRNVTFATILKNLERHYNVNFENHSKVLQSERLNVNFGNEPLAKVLEYLHDDFGIDYTIKSNTIILK